MYNNIYAYISQIGWTYECWLNTQLDNASSSIVS